MIHDTIVEITDLVKHYGYGDSRVTVIRDLSLSIKKGETVAIVGPSGAGKSTLLNIAGCLDTYQKGKVSVLSKDVPPFSVDDMSSFRNEHIGFIFQMHNLLPEFNAIENIMMPLVIRRWPRKRAREEAMHLLEHFGLTDRATHKPAELSGGENQRIAVARAMVGNPDIVLADEPTGNLDTANSDLLTSRLLDLGREKQATIIIVTHDASVAARTERVVTLVDGSIVDDTGSTSGEATDAN